MGFLSKLASKAAKKVIPKILVGGTKADRQAVQSFVKSGSADPVFDKFGQSLEQGVKVAAGITGAVLTAGALAPAALGGSAAAGGAAVGGAAPLVKSLTTPSVGLIDKISKGINKVNAFSQTDLGASLIGTLGKVVSNLGTPSAGKPSAAAQSAALRAGNITAPSATVSQAAVFEGKGVRVEIGSGSGSDTWWNRNKSWALPVILAVPGFFIMLFMLFGGRRR